MTDPAHIAALRMLLDDGELNAQHFRMLGIICAHGPISTGEAASRIGLSYQQTSRIIRRLLDDEMVRYMIDGDDARVRRIAATRKGEAFDLRIRQAIARAMNTKTEDTAA